MAFLPIDSGCREWRVVCEYMDARISELTDICTSVGSTDQQRLDAAIRIDELRDMKKAPERTKATAVHRLTNRPQGAY